MCDAGDYQWNRLGVFQYQYDAPDGRPVYFKVSSEYQSTIYNIQGIVFSRKKILSGCILFNIRMFGESIKCPEYKIR